MARSDAAVLSSLIRHAKLVSEDPITPLIDRYMIERGKARRRLETLSLDMIPRNRPGGRLSPSSVGGCQRQALFRFVGLEAQNRLDPDTELIFDDGDWHHRKWQYRFRDAQRVLGSSALKVIGIEKPVQIPELYMAGTYDALIRIGGKLILIDIKSINDYGFHYIYRTHKPKEEHVRQVLSYCAARGVRTGALLYDNKNKSQYKVYIVEWTEEAWAEVERWCRRVIHHLDNQNIPGRHPGCSRGTFLWEHCPFSAYCFDSRYREHPEKLQRLTFRNFPGTEAAWKASNDAA